MLLEGCVLGLFDPALPTAEAKGVVVRCICPFALLLFGQKYLALLFK